MSTRLSDSITELTKLSHLWQYWWRQFKFSHIIWCERKSQTPILWCQKFPIHYMRMRSLPEVWLSAVWSSAPWTATPPMRKELFFDTRTNTLFTAANYHQCTSVRGTLAHLAFFPPDAPPQWLTKHPKGSCRALVSQQEVTLGAEVALDSHWGKVQGPAPSSLEAV